jgi:hypothetical protein
MTDPGRVRHVEIKDGDETVAAAEVTTSRESGGTAQASLRAMPGHIAPGTRSSLVDAVMDLPEVQASEHLQAAVPLGDGESLERLRERADETTTRPAGSTALLDANIPQDREPGSGWEPGETSSPLLYLLPGGHEPHALRTADRRSFHQRRTIHPRRRDPQRRRCH